MGHYFYHVLNFCLIIGVLLSSSSIWFMLIMILNDSWSITLGNSIDCNSSLKVNKNWDS